MFCFQCERADRSGQVPGCSGLRGNCGKDADTAGLQDLLIHATKGIAQYAAKARALDAADDEAAGFIHFAVFSTLTNVNFSPTRFVRLLQDAAAVRDRVKARYEEAARARGLEPETLTGPATWEPAADMAGLLEQAAGVGINAGIDVVGPDVVGLRSLILFAIKGIAAYAEHARVLGHQTAEVNGGVEEALAYLAGNPVDAGEMVQRALDLGKLNLAVMELLDAANTGTYGTPTPTTVRTTPVAGKAILVSGHDLKYLAALLEQTKDSGINVYTNGEMLPAHGYPLLKQYPHLVANYGSAWHNQQQEFAEFPGPILMTSNCILEPHASYRQRIFTTGPVGWPGVRHITDDNYTPVIQAAKALPGFKETAPEEKSIMVGFGRDAVLSVADSVIKAVKEGVVRHFFLIGGCDGPTPGRGYFGEFARQAPEDTIILTLGCGKYQFNTHDFGEIGGIPRLLDIGQCNDAFSAIKIALALADAFDCGVNDLPLTLVISWNEQKAVSILMTLLVLGVRNIHLGPSLPAFLTPNLIQTLVDQFGLKPTGDVAADLAAALAPATS